MSQQVVFVVTQHIQLGNTTRQTGVWLEELVAPYYALRDAGIAVTFATPAGGVVPIDPNSLKPKGENAPAIERYLADEALQQQVRQTRRAADLLDAPFDAVFFPGGHGAMWDLPVDAGVTRLTERAFAQGKFIASVCHGAAGLTSAKRADGRSIVAGLRVNSFTDAEEAAVGLTAVVPFPLETRLRELGGRFEHGDNWQAFAIRDGQLITGQNPQSSEQVAKLLLEALGAKVRGVAA